MAKTKPIGVRFDGDLLEMLKEDKLADSPQKALNFLTEFYRQKKDKVVNFTEQFGKSKLFSKKQSKEAYNGAPLPTTTQDEPKQWQEPKTEEKPIFNADEINKRLKELESELKSPPKNPMIGLRKWKQVRESEIAQLKDRL